ncbi:MAG: ATP-grasp domain-containing protein [Bacteroidales bacterium]|jgi:biotin carboxylase|nr:ATP-grasp domain-containing protein [Bacteroidales bacterium]
MQNNKKIALVLSGINPHIELIRQLQERGYYVILIDFAENPPAKKYADEHIKESLLDKEIVLKIAKKRNASLVISVAAERANAVSCYVLEKMGLYCPYSYDTAMKISEKSTMKQIMSDNNILTANFNIINSLESIQDIPLEFPIVIKPLDGYGSKGVRKICSVDELNITVEKALSISKSKNVLLEEYISGREMSVDCFIDENKSHILLIREKQNIIQNDDELQSFGSISPADVSKKLLSNIQQIANQIRDAFKLRNTPLLIQIIAKEDKAFVLEFSPRLGGGLCFRTVKLHTDFDYVSSCINSFLGIKQEISINRKEIYYSIHNIYSKKGKFSRIVGVEDLISMGIIKEIYINKAVGVEVGNDFSSSSRVGQFIVEGKSRNEIYDKIKTTFENLEVYDTNNIAILLKDFYLKNGV